MAALLLVVMICLVAYQWLLEPWLVALEGPLELRWLPWLGLVLAGWLLSGESRGGSGRRSGE